MKLLIAGLVIFFAVHFVPAMPGLKRSLQERLGANGYRGAFSVVSLAGFALIIWGFSVAEWVDVYFPPEWGRHVTMVLVLLAFICFAAANMKGHIRKTLKHPMLTGIVLWATGHLLANGDQASVLLFGSFLVYSVVDMALATAQGRVAEFQPKPTQDIAAVVAGAVIYGVFVFLHPYLIGVPVI